MAARFVRTGDVHAPNAPSSGCDVQSQIESADQGREILGHVN